MDALSTIAQDKLRLEIIKAEQEASLIERKNLQLRAAIEPRRLTGVQKLKLRESLSGHPTPVAIATCSFDNEAGDFADDLAAALSEANWNNTRGMLINCSYGVKIGAMADTIGIPEVKLLSDALIAAGIPNEPVILEQEVVGSVMTFPLQSHAIYLLIEKHPPLSRPSGK
jgi:hypothetical protein